jgi:hypothetical protein
VVVEAENYRAMTLHDWELIKQIVLSGDAEYHYFTNPPQPLNKSRMAYASCFIPLGLLKMGDFFKGEKPQLTAKGIKFKESLMAANTTAAIEAAFVDISVITDGLGDS